MHNTASALIKKYKRARPRAADPVSISVAITPPGREISPPRRFSTVIVASHELFRIKCPFYDPRPSSHIASPSLSLFLFFYLIRVDCTTTGHQAPREGMHDSVTSKSRQDDEGYIVRRPPKRGSYRFGVVFSRRRGRNVSFVCRNACLALARATAPRRNFEIFYNYW